MPQNSTRSLAQHFATVLVAAVVFCLGYAFLTVTPEQTGMFNPDAILDTSTIDDLRPAEETCTTDYECAAVELLQANAAGEVVFEDLSFDGASELYGAENDLLADEFWAQHQGQDWTVAQEDLKDWLDGQIGPC